MGGKKKLDKDQINSRLKEHGCSLLGEYKNNRIPIKFQCKCGKIGSKSLSNFLKRPFCSNCGYKIRHQHRRLSLDEASKEYEKYGHTLLETIYINNQTKMKYKCKCGNISFASLGNMQQGATCKSCRFAKISKENNYQWIKDRAKIRENRRIHQMSKPYKRKFRKDNNILDTQNYHVDHIFPIKAFVEHGIYDLDIINSEDNLQFLSKSENSSKNDKYDKEKFNTWLESKLSNYIIGDK